MFRHRTVLLTSSILAGLLVSSTALAQSTPVPVDTKDTGPAGSAPQDASPERSDDIVVTGSLLRRTNTETASPVTTLTSANLDRAGITNVADAVRSISADNSGSVPTAFSAGFAAGAAGVSLRGLTVNSTLVLIDGVRTVNYPAADDGQRSFVDLNSIPRSTIDRIEVLKDGASSVYGADAIGGVVNIITRREVRGIEGTAEGGISQRGDGGEQRVTLTGGYGSLSEQGFNVYINGEYERDGLIKNSDRGFPFNTTDLTSIGGDNLNVGATGGFAARVGTISAVVRPAIQTTPGDIFSGVPITGAPTRVLSPSGCSTGTIQHNDASGAYCEQNQVPYGTVQPQQTRYGFTGHATVQVGDIGEAYLNATYYHSETFVTASPSNLRVRNPINSYNTVLPALLSNGQLNPQDPYAAQGLAANITYSFGDIPVTGKTDNDLYRVAGGLKGKFGQGWTYALEGSFARSTLDVTATGAISIAGLTSAINNGTYNFIDPSRNTQAVRDSVSPVLTTRATSELYMVQGTVTKELLQLPGGPLQLGVGGSVRYESVNNPNANLGNVYLSVNAVTAQGHRTVSAGYFEMNAPVLKQVELNASGRYDHYSDGLHNFSPKVGIKVTPFRQLALRGTYSRGFRAPSFAETSGTVLGFITGTVPSSVAAAHGNDGYVLPYSLGLRSIATPDLKPEKSRSFTGGAIFQPTRWLSMTIDYYNIKKTGVIAAGPLSGSAQDAYYAGQPIPAGYTFELDDVDPLHPNALRKILVVNSPYANAGSLETSGLDLSLQANLRLGSGVKLTSRLEGTEILTYDFDPGDGVVDHYVGTQAPYITSSGAGTPRWRANWQNTIETGPFALTATAYYTSGYKSVAVDYVGHGATSCSDQLYDPGLGDAFCHTKGFFDLDLTGQVKVNDKFSFYVNVINLLDAAPPLNPANYAATNYNPTWSQNGIVGRFFRAGANFKF